MEKKGTTASVKNTMEHYGGYVFAKANNPKGAVFVLVFKKV